jgi:hypothetical protein
METMTREQLEAYKLETDAINERSKAYKAEIDAINAHTEAMKREIAATKEQGIEETKAFNDRTEAMKRETAMLKEQSAEMAAQNERSIVLQARRTYQSEIHGVAINVLVSILTKDALRAMRDSEFSAAAAKIDVGEVVEYSLIVGKRYVDELHKIPVSDRQIAEHKDHLALMSPLPQVARPDF